MRLFSFTFMAPCLRDVVSSPKPAAISAMSHTRSRPGQPAISDVDEFKTLIARLAFDPRRYTLGMWFGSTTNGVSASSGTPEMP
jgi:hypothetical protein